MLQICRAGKFGDLQTSAPSTRGNTSCPGMSSKSPQSIKQPTQDRVPGLEVRVNEPVLVMRPDPARVATVKIASCDSSAGAYAGDCWTE